MTRIQSRCECHIRLTLQISSRLIPESVRRLLENMNRIRLLLLVLLASCGGVIDAVEERAPDGFSSIDDVLSFEQRKAIVRGYASTAGFAQEQVNKAA